MRLSPIAIIAVLLLCAARQAAANPNSADFQHLGVATYPNAVLRQSDHRVAAESATDGTLFQWVSNDAPQAVVAFYEKSTGATAAFMKMSSTYTLYTPQGTMINVVGPEDGIPEIDAGGRTTKTWKSLITIMRFDRIEANR
ncbi:MAG TPA: hypothetical protein VFN94_10755 [Nitrospiria bacterium]|nr:hypothetical protein [Nitrospiria bacterium]